MQTDDGKVVYVHVDLNEKCVIVSFRFNQYKNLFKKFNKNFNYEISLQSP